ncbi:DUF3500 domain-containing protein [Sorangium sp. So ce296]|uniref:DUF3500 domain-containing protein n=1 Tax=Sorangium sp. So ce296 TaxID=3133296 RepID=UPI003F61F35E
MRSIAGRAAGADAAGHRLASPGDGTIARTAAPPRALRSRYPRLSGPGSRIAATLMLAMTTSCNSMRPQEAPPGEPAAAPASPSAPAQQAAEPGPLPTPPSPPAPAGPPGAAPPPGGAAGRATAEAIAASARAFVDGLDGEARGRALLAFQSREREDWHYVPRRRAGLALGDMDGGERGAAHALLRAGLSPEGYRKVEGVLLLEGILGGIEGNPAFRDPGRYHLALFGQPGPEAPWGFRFEGHHVSLNFTSAGGGVATTPAFLGANPAEVPSGPRKGLRVLAAEEDLGRAFLASLTPAQRQRAVIAATAPPDLVTEASRRAALASVEGLPAAEMTPAQRAALLRLLEAYARNFPADLADGHLDRIARAGVERLHFAWAGSASPKQSHYYRIHGPTHLIEYDNRGGDHIHTVFRDLQDDFGDSLLARHLQEGHGAPARGRP